MRKYLSAFLLFSVFTINAQKIGDPFVPALDVIKEAVKLNDDKKYDQAIEQYAKINPCDSLYYLALYEMALTYTNMKEYDKVISCCKKGLTLESSEEKGFFDLLGTAYDYKDSQDSALYYYNLGIKKFPHYHKFYFETGVSYIGKKNDSTALRYLIKSAMLNPLHSGTHLQLALLAARNGHYTSAALAYQYFLVLENNTQRALNALNEFQKLCNNNIVISEKPINLAQNGNNFGEMDEIVKSRAAQIESYKSKVKLSFTDVTKQCQIISEKFKFDDSDKGFYNQFYGKLLTKVWQKGFFEALMYTIFSGVNDDKVQSLVKKNEKDINAFGEFMLGIINDYRKDIKHQIDGKDIEGQRYFFRNGTIEAVGKTENEKKTGKWYIYSNNGAIKNIGMYVNGEPEGLWVAFFDNGIKRNEVIWSKGKRNGPYTIFYQNGTIKEKGIYVNNEVEGEITTFYSNGAPKDIMLVKNGTQNGSYNVFNQQGIKSAVASYENNKLNGKVINYFKNGVVSEEREFKNGECVGLSKGNYISGELSYSGNYKNGKYDGLWTWYHKNGKKSKEVYYADGKVTKTWTEYYDNGKVKEIFNYGSDEALDGEFKLYTRKGQLYNDGKYKNNKLLNMTFYDESGKIIYETKNRDSDYMFKKYYINGNVEEEGQVTNKLRDGKFIRNYTFGAKGTEVNYKNGKYDGVNLKYHPNGKISEQYMCRENEYDGYFKQYYSNGNLSAEGYYNLGKLTGPYIIYYRNGAVKEKFYYSNNEAIGYGEYYDAKGKLANRNYYSDIITTKVEFFDTLGKAFQVVEYKNNDPITSFFFNKQKHEEISQVFGKKHGKYIEYHPNGKVKETCSFVYGNLEGPLKKYTPAGKLLMTQEYKNDLQQGQELWYDENGNVEFTENTKDGKLNGKKTWFYDNGKIHSEKNYYENEEDSAAYFYGEDGTLAVQFLYNEGALVGYTHLDKNGKLLPYTPIKNETANIVTYYPNGKKSREVNYVFGQVQGKRSVYYSNGQPYLEATFVDDLNEGLAKEFYTNGKVKSESMYQNGELNGVEKIYYDTGILQSECNYVNNIKYGPEKIYDKTGKLISTYYNIDGDSFVK